MQQYGKIAEIDITECKQVCFVICSVNIQRREDLWIGEEINNEKDQIMKENRCEEKQELISLQLILMKTSGYIGKYTEGN